MNKEEYLIGMAALFLIMLGIGFFLHWLFDYRPKLIREIYSKEGEIHFRRWSYFSSSFCNVYLHKIYKADKDEHLHNHPWNFVSIVLRGGYRELTQHSIFNRRLFSFEYRPASEFHKITELYGETTTLVITFGKHRSWGFLVNDKIISNEQYRNNKHK